MTDDELKARLKAVCIDLWWRSESDYPVEVVWQPKNDVTETDAIASIPVSEFFSKQTTPKSWDTAEDRAQRVQLQQLQELLEGNLTNLQIYRRGEVEVTVYVLGRTAEGTLAGVRTTLVKT